MVLYRRKKKESVAVMTQEQDRLENELKAKVAAIEVAPETSGDTPARPIEVAFQRLRTESTLLVRQNMVLQEHVHLHRGFRGYIQRNCDEFLRELSGTDTVSSSPKQQVRSSRTIQPLICNSPWVALSRQQADGFRVLFSSGEPSFYLPGDMHTRFFQLVTRQVTVNEAQNRSVRFVVPVVAADSSDNARSRAAEDPCVRWVVEGGHSVKFTEVNESTLDIEYDHWAVCEDEPHDRPHMCADVSELLTLL